ncbi:MAG: ECF-type sigma factor [Planctomycetota bacterium]
MEQDPPSPKSVDDLLPEIYDRLRAIARRSMANERSDHTLGATALVHEAYVKLAGRAQHDGGWANEAHFFVAAAEAMRRVLVDHARGRMRLKRGGDGRAASRKIDPSVIASLSAAAEADAEEILALDEAFQRLERENPRGAAVVRLRFYAGLSVEHSATILAVSPRTIKREWAFARARLFDLLGSESK